MSEPQDTVTYREVQQHSPRARFWRRVVGPLLVFVLLPGFVFASVFWHNEDDVTVQTVSVLFAFMFVLPWMRRTRHMMAIEIRRRKLVVTHSDPPPWSCSVDQIAGCRPMQFKAAWTQGGHGRGERDMFKCTREYISLKGDRGVELELPNGRSMFIGSGKPEELIQAIRDAQAAAPQDTSGDRNGCEDQPVTPAKRRRALLTVLALLLLLTAIFIAWPYVRGGDSGQRTMMLWYALSALWFLLMLIGWITQRIRKVPLQLQPLQPLGTVGCILLVVSAAAAIANEMGWIGLDGSWRFAVRATACYGIWLGICLRMYFRQDRERSHESAAATTL